MVRCAAAAVVRGSQLPRTVPPLWVVVDSPECAQREPNVVIQSPGLETFVEHLLYLSSSELTRPDSVVVLAVLRDLPPECCEQFLGHSHGQSREGTARVTAPEIGTV